MSKKKEETGKNFRDYPEAYFTIIEHFDESTEDYCIEGSYNQLSASRHDLYRFREALNRSYNEDPLARKLSNVFRDLTISILPYEASREDPATLIIRLNPLVKAVIEANRPKQS